MIFYLSGTGNTRWVAESLSRSLGERLINVADVFDTDCRFKLCKDEIVGFCFPIHGWRPPKLMLDFISRLRVDDMWMSRPYSFAVCTVGDTSGEAMDIFSEDAYYYGSPIKTMFDIRMPNTYVGQPFMDVDSKTVEANKLEEAKQRLAEITERLKDREKVVDLKFRGKWQKINTRYLGALFVDCLLTDKPFSVDASLCVRCGKCAAVCPVDNIKGGVGELPIWKHNKKCMTCFACYHNCPKHAIRYGLMTSGKGQYRFTTPPQKE